MHFTTSFFLLLTALFALSLATPIPDFEDIERRWSKGETEDSIHAHANIRTATPAWPVARSAAPASFITTPDELTQRRSLAEHGENTPLGARLRSFASRLLRSKGESGLIESRGMERRGLESWDGEAPVLKPRRQMRYHFTA